MEILHLTMKVNRSDWAISDTAQYFGVSVGLVSENLKLAEAFHTTPKLMEIGSRQAALTKLNGH